MKRSGTAVGVNRRGPAESVLENGEHWEKCGFFVESNEYSASAARTLADMRRDSDLWFRLSTSEEGEEIMKLYKMRCNSYIVKTVDFEQFLRLVRSITEYWFTVVVLPSADSVEKARARRI
jgi:hypothetical protein